MGEKAESGHCYCGGCCWVVELEYYLHQELQVQNVTAFPLFLQ
jgi:hypothetical protein